MKQIVMVLVLLGWTASAQAEQRFQLPTQTERTVTDVASYITLGVLMGLDTKASWDCPRRTHCLVMQGVRYGVTSGATEVVKRLVHRNRPCVPECGVSAPNESFWSGHTAEAFQTIGGPRLMFSLPLAIGTGGLRVAAGKHWVTDTLIGAAVGLATSRIR